MNVSSLLTVSKRTRLVYALILSILPWPAVWFGLYKLHSLLWTFVLYHGVVMLTASVAGFQLWRDDIRLPTKLQWMGPAVAAFVMSVAGILLYETVGRDLINPTSVLTAMSSRGFRDSQFLGFATYFVIVNATLEELFWRGVVLNELKGLALRQRSFGTWWTAASFGAWHYLVMRLLLRGFWPLVAAAFIMLCGIFLDLVYQRTRNILLAIVWHALVFDVPIILIFGIVLANSKG